MTDFYNGPALLRAAGAELVVTVRLFGQVEPVDGHYHWAGRIDAHPQVEELARSGRQSVTLRIGDREPVPARLSEVDPWGAVRIKATAPPPW